MMSLLCKQTHAACYCCFISTWTTLLFTSFIQNIWVGPKVGLLSGVRQLLKNILCSMGRLIPWLLGSSGYFLILWNIEGYWNWHQAS